jgi:transcriptional regulator with XRE-family HTH domain
MLQSQEKSLPPPDPMFERLRRYQVTEGLTWKQVAERLGISVSTIMAVKAQTRKLSPRALFRLEEAERKATARRSAAEQVANTLINEEGSGRELVKIANRSMGGQRISLEYIDARRGRALPQTIKLLRPSPEGCRRLRVLFAATLDVRMVLMACLPPDHRTEPFVGLLKQTTVSRLQSASLELVFGREWRARLAEISLTEKSTGTADQA